MTIRIGRVEAAACCALSLWLAMSVSDARQWSEGSGLQRGA